MQLLRLLRRPRACASCCLAPFLLRLPQLRNVLQISLLARQSRLVLQIGDQIPVRAPHLDPAPTLPRLLRGLKRLRLELQSGVTRIVYKAVATLL